MSMRKLIFLMFIPLLLAATGDPYQAVVPSDRPVLQNGINRYIHDQMRRDWADLYEIKIPGYPIMENFDDLSLKTQILSKQQFADEMDELHDNGTLPVMQSFELTTINKVTGGYEVQGCSKAKRENYNFKGIVTFNAYIADGQIHFGGWRFIHAMPHSCTQKKWND